MCNRTIYKRISMAFISIPTSISGVNIPGKMGKIASGPLALLFNGKGVETKRYPLDLGTDAAKLHYVTFSVREIIPASVQEAPAGSIAGNTVSMAGFANVVTGVSDGISSLFGSASTEFGNITNTAPSAGYTPSLSAESKIGNAVGTFLDSKPTSVTNQIGDWLTKGVAISPRLSKLTSVISLYMPDTLYAEYNSDYSEFSLTDDLGGPIATIKAINQIADKNNLQGVDSVQSALKAIGNAIGTQPESVYLASKAFGMENVGAVLNKAQGYAVNPQIQMIYKGIGLRSFQLTFTFTPKSAKEAKEVDDIIHLFKFHYAPRLESGTETSVNSMFFIPPSMFTVQFMHAGKENTHLPKYGECVLSHITVDYAPNGFAAYEDGAPVQSMLMLQFQETEIIDRNKLEKGYLR